VDADAISAGREMLEAIRSDIDVFLPCFIDRVGHAAEAMRTVDVERGSAALIPRCEDEVRIFKRVIAMKVRKEHAGNRRQR